MIILVDGYNVLKQIYDGQVISEQQRRAFIKELARYQHLRKHKKIILVFDGGPDPWVTQEKVHGILVVYSGAGQTADDCLHSFMKKHKEKAGNILLVSSDRQLCHWADEYKMASIDAHEFYRFMRQIIKPSAKIPENQEPIKLSKSFNPRLDALMREAARYVVPKSEDTQEIQDKMDKGRKLSKEERILLKKVKKL